MRGVQKGSGRDSKSEIQEEILRRLFQEEKRRVEGISGKPVEIDAGRHGRRRVRNKPKH